jgi:hypothetical protein
VHALDSPKWDAETEYSRYLSLQGSTFTVGSDLFAWWRAHAQEFPALVLLVREYFACPLTSAATERLGSAGGRTITFDRSGLHPNVTADLLFICRNVALLRALGMWSEFDMVIHPQQQQEAAAPASH